MPLTNFFRSFAFAHWLLYAVALWVLVGLLGTALSSRRGERARVRRGLPALLLVVTLYMGTLLAVSLRQPARVLAPGQSRCFGAVCFSVAAAQELPGFQARDQTRARLVRLTIAVHNTDRENAVGEPDLRATLVDDHGHSWSVVPGLSGVSLSTRIEPSGTITSDPVFRVPRDASGLHLELLHKGWYVGRFVIGDPESLLHRSTQLQLPATSENLSSTTNSGR